VIYGNEVTVGDMPTELFPGGMVGQSRMGGPAMIFLDINGKVLINFTGVAALGTVADGATPTLRYQILVDGRPILPTIPEISLSPANTGATLAVTAMPTVSAGPHTIQVVAQSSTGVTHVIRNTALTVVGPLE
jgi:hypothetical protein